jgi:hypothetical protein
MSQSDPLQTRTAEASTPPPKGPSGTSSGGSLPARTEVLGGKKMDPAAVDFAREREREPPRCARLTRRPCDGCGSR